MTFSKCKTKNLRPPLTIKFHLIIVGEDCSEDVNECAEGNGALGICHEDNTERCENKYGAYTCHCKPGFYKDQCQFSTPDAAPNAAKSTGENVVSFYIFVLNCQKLQAIFSPEDLFSCFIHSTVHFGYKEHLGQWQVSLNYILPSLILEALLVVHNIYEIE